MNLLASNRSTLPLQMSYNCKNKGRAINSNQYNVVEGRKLIF